jgi:hypothetical protein
VDIHLPNALLRGRTVHAESGEPFGGTVVSLYAADSPDVAAEAETGDDGLFEFAALEPTKYSLSAAGLSARSQLEFVDVGSRDADEDVVLRMRPSHRRVLQVLSSFGAVPGARVAIRSVDRLAEGDSLYRSGIDGEVEFEVDAETGRIAVDIGASGFSYWLGGVDVTNDAPQVVYLDQLSGTLTLDLVDLSSPELIVAEFPVLIHGGGFTWPFGLRPWSSMNGGGQVGTSLAIPEMPGGSYSLCRLPISALGVLGALAASEGGGANCASGILIPGADLQLVLPDSPQVR